MLLSRPVAERKHLLDPKDRIFVEKHSLKDYRKAPKYIFVVAMLGATVIVVVALGVLLTGASNGSSNSRLSFLGVLGGAVS